ncbi:hypothetical protein BG55_05645 [Erwinia mallotivora]|uniref:Uncharacterized protein n=1 Tax=Erwinia mallotivora TaxID=69222 RepID=A0A014NAJ9_9GAMM|nr:hypothetical protein BG55_05645 [Erwinia mallotivora]
MIAALFVYHTASLRMKITLFFHHDLRFYPMIVMVNRNRYQNSVINMCKILTPAGSIADWTGFISLRENGA